MAVIRFNRPAARNALTLDGMRTFAEIVTELADSPYLRAVIVTGAGDAAFCAGGDLHDLAPLKNAEDGALVGHIMGDALHQLERLPVPVIGAINGYALGGGAEIALACDIRIVDENVRFGLVHKKVGIIPGWGGGQRLLRLVGYSAAMKLLLQANVLNGLDMQRLGLTHDITATGQALVGAHDFVESFADASLDVVRAIKGSLLAGTHRPYTDALAAEQEPFPALWAAKPHLDAVDRFINRRSKKES